MSNELNELLDACHTGAEVSDEKLLEIGETNWLLGMPTASSKGTIALKTRNGIEVVFQQEDVVEVKKHNEEFLVKVRTGSDILCKFAAVSKLQSGSKDCQCHDKNKPLHAKERIDEGDLGSPTVGDRGCVIIGFRIIWFCYTIVGQFGIQYLVCFPIIDYVSVCP